jgi:hypothetical protein
VDGVEDLPLRVGDNLAGVLFVPVPVQVLRYGAELDQEVAGQVFRLNLTTLFFPKPEQGGLVVTHNDPGVRTPYKAAAVTRNLCRINPAHVFLRLKSMNMEYQMIYELSYDHSGCQC